MVFRNFLQRKGVKENTPQNLLTKTSFNVELTIFNLYPSMSVKPSSLIPNVKEVFLTDTIVSLENLIEEFR